MIDNSIGTNLFRNFWVSTPEKGKFDSLEDGELSCAFYISGLLTLLGLAETVHGTVGSTTTDLLNCGWQIVDEPEPGDVILWAPSDSSDSELLQHVGFYIGNGRCISNWREQKSPKEHDLNYDPRFVVETIYRCTNWNRLDERRSLSQ